MNEADLTATKSQYMTPIEDFCRDMSKPLCIRRKYATSLTFERIVAGLVDLSVTPDILARTWEEILQLEEQMKLVTAVSGTQFEGGGGILDFERKCEVATWNIFEM